MGSLEAPDISVGADLSSCLQSQLTGVPGDGWRARRLAVGWNWDVSEVVTFTFLTEGSLESRMEAMDPLRVSILTYTPWRREWQPSSVFLPGEFCGQRSWWAVVHGVAKSWTGLSD